MMTLRVNMRTRLVRYDFDDVRTALGRVALMLEVHHNLIYPTLIVQPIWGIIVSR